MQLAYFEDLQPGFVCRAQGYTVNEAEIIEFGQRFDPQPFHTSADAASNSLFGGLVAPTCLLLCARSWLANHLDVPYVYTAGLGVDDLNIRKPVRAGDCLRLEAEVFHARPSRSRPDCGVVQMHNRLYNQRDELVLDMIAKMLVQKKSAQV
jgi:acyl dehydratase